MCSADTDQIELPQPPPLVLRAFNQARSRGKQDWYRMTPAVLKNRMLQLGGSQLDELLDGKPFHSWWAEQPYFSIDRASHPVEVELRESCRPLVARATPSGDGVRVRREFWRAVVGPPPGMQYSWDQAAKR